MTSNRSQPSHRIEIALAYSVATLVVLSILAFFSVLIGTAAGMRGADFASGAWPVVAVLPWFALPVAFLVILILLLINGVRRRREARATQ